MTVLNEIVLRLLVIAAIIAPPAKEGLQRSAAKSLKASVLLHTYGMEYEDGMGQRVTRGCSGTYVAPTLILTAAHCFDGMVLRKIWARGPFDALGYPVHLVAWDKGLDLALVEAPFRHPFVDLGKPPKWGDHVFNVGSPWSFEFVYSEGSVAATDFTMESSGGTYIVTTAMVNPGSSGGGAFDKKGRLIGVNAMLVGFAGWNGLTLAVDVKTIRAFLDRMVPAIVEEWE